METFPKEMINRLKKSGVVAGFAVEKAEYAVPICKALKAGGIDAIELTLRTDAALEALKAICAADLDIVVGVGTVLTEEQAVAVKEAGADFAVAPGMNPRVIKKAQEIGLAFAPGIATPSELEISAELGCRFVKFFPAEAQGGLKYLKSMGAPYKHLGMQYFPLGGVNAENMIDYLNEPNIPTVGGSWIVKKDLVDAEDWEGISARAEAVSSALQK